MLRQYATEGNLETHGASGTPLLALKFGVVDPGPFGAYSAS
jgi:hypothetical protein